MGLENFVSIAEIVAGFAVLVTLIFLTLELRSSAKTLRANTNAESYENWATVNEFLSQHPDQVAISQTFDPSKTLSEFTEVEQAAIRLLARSLFQRFQSLYFKYSAGILTEDVWQQNRVWCSGLVNAPIYKAIWDDEKGQPIFIPEFVFSIESAPVVKVSAGAASGQFDESASLQE